MLDQKRKKVLIVTNGQPSPPLFPHQDGQYVVTDLASAGLPFDLVTYGAYLKMNFDDTDCHDVVILNGHTSPESLELVAQKCTDLMRTGRKIFINGRLPFCRFNGNDKKPEYCDYGGSLFGYSATKHRLTGKVRFAGDIQKHQKAANKRMLWQEMDAFTIDVPPDIAISIGGHIVGFLGEKGGVIGGTNEYLVGLVDYGKLVHYLRYKTTNIVGFSNDRIESRPIAAFEVHCDVTHDPDEIEALVRLARKHQIPLACLLVYANLSPAAVEKWTEAASEPLIRIGSHSRTHPFIWPKVVDFANETVDALVDQRKLLSVTGNYFNFSGKMNPTPSQVAELFSAGVVFGAMGAESRFYGLPFGVPWQYFPKRTFKRLIWKVVKRIFPPVFIQKMPTNTSWFEALSQLENVPYCFSHTCLSDWGAWGSRKNYFEQIKEQFAANEQFGLYTFGFIHDYLVNEKKGKFKIKGVHMAEQIDAAMLYLKQKGVHFIFADELILRLWDFAQGAIDYEEKNDGCLKVNVYRPAARANQVKISCKDNCRPSARGTSVVAQHEYADWLYVDLKPEVFSSFDIEWSRNAQRSRAA